MNILITDFGPERREKNRQLKNLVSGLAAHPEVKLLLACREGSALAALARENKLAPMLCKPGKFGSLIAGLRLRWRLRKPGRPWLLHCFDQESLALVMPLAAKKQHLKLVYAALRPEPIRHKLALENIHLVKAVVADTCGIADLFVSCGFLPSSVFVIPGGLDPSGYPERRPRDDGRVIFACSDPLEEGRGYAQLLDGLACLSGRADMPSWEVRLAGGGPLFEDFLDQARERCVESRLAIFGGIDAPEILPDCDIMLCPADRDDGGSLSLKEGWASGLPVICADIPAQAELAEDGKNALFFRNGDPADLADKMSGLAHDPARRAALAAAGRQALAAYTAEVLLCRHLELYRKLLGLRPGQDSTVL